VQVLFNYLANCLVSLRKLKNKSINDLCSLLQLLC